LKTLRFQVFFAYGDFPYGVFPYIRVASSK